MFTEVYVDNDKRRLKLLIERFQTWNFIRRELFSSRPKTFMRKIYVFSLFKLKNNNL